MNRLIKISQAFSRAAEIYDKHALIQKFIAEKLTAKILNQTDSSLGTILEIGCGTGILSSHLASHAENYILTDISLRFLQKAREKIKGENVFPLVLDGERPCFPASFDLIVSNLALHWFQDPKSALFRLVGCLKPGGKLYITSLGNNTFYEWRTAHTLMDASCGILDFISFGQLKDWLPLSGTRHIEEEWITLAHSDARHFLQNLKATGGCFPHPGHTPLPHKTFKKVMNAYNQNPQISCQILYAFYQKPQKMREE